MSPNSVIGVWATASRQKGTVRDRPGLTTNAGPWVQVSRLGNPLFNEVIVPMARKDEWNAVGPSRDNEYEQLVKRPELAGAAAGALPGRLPEPGGVQQGPRRPARHPAHRHPRPASCPGSRTSPAPQPGDMLRLNAAIAADGRAEPARARRRRRRRLPERAPARRRRDDDRAAGRRRRDDPARRPDLHARRRRRRRSPTARTTRPTGASSAAFPYIGLPHDGYSVPAA